MKVAPWASVARDPSGTGWPGRPVLAGEYALFDRGEADLTDPQLLAGRHDLPEPIRLPVISDDRRSSGFPAGHPPMDSFLGVPIRSPERGLRQSVSDPSGVGEFSNDDEDLVLVRPATAGIAIENARLYEESAYAGSAGCSHRPRSAAWSSSTDPGHRTAPELIVDHVLRLADADVVTLVVPVGVDTLAVVVAAGESATELLGFRYAEQDTLVEQAMTSGKACASVRRVTSTAITFI